jgi:hypothetical protein
MYERIVFPATVVTMWYGVSGARSALLPDKTYLGVVPLYILHRICPYAPLGVPGSTVDTIIPSVSLEVELQWKIRAK